MGANFDAAFDHVIGAEGGYTNDVHDAGGPTNWGITQAVLSEWRHKKVTADDVKNLTKDEAKVIYLAKYWIPMRLDKVPSFLLQVLLFDQGVNRGPVTAVKEFQKVLKIEDDGLIGKDTLAAIAKWDERDLALEYCFDMQDDYIAIMKAKPTQVKFIAGWINRSQALIKKVWKLIKGV